MHHDNDALAAAEAGLSSLAVTREEIWEPLNWFSFGSGEYSIPILYPEAREVKPAFTEKATSDRIGDSKGAPSALEKRE